MRRRRCRLAAARQLAAAVVTGCTQCPQKGATAQCDMMRVSQALITAREEGAEDEDRGQSPARAGPPPPFRRDRLSAPKPGDIKQGVSYAA